jgi:hypothetical protein
LGLLTVLAIPYLRFSLTQGDETLHHLTMLNSYWVRPIPFYEKLLTYFTRYIKGFNPLYWFWPSGSFIEKYWPNVSLPGWLFSAQGDLARHTMKGYGHILLITFPFWLIGLINCIRRFKQPAYRTLLIATLAVPSGAAIVDWGITRGLVFIIPATLMTAHGLETSIHWLRMKWKRLRYWLVSGILFLCLAGISFWMLYDALQNGPTWYHDYGLSGLQYGASQVFPRAAEIAQAEPDTTILVSSTWANGSDVLLRYFTDDLINLRMGNINAWGLEYHPLDRNILFVMTQDDLDYVYDSGKFNDISVEEIIPYPDGNSGFYFVRLEYIDDIEAILADEREARQGLHSEIISIQEQPVKVEYSTLDMNEITHVFDGDPTTLIRTLEANPLRLILTFPEPIEINGVTLVIGGIPTRMTVNAFRNGEKLDTAVKEVGQASVIREEDLRFVQELTVDKLQIEILSPNDGEIAHVHLWEVTLE